MFVLRHSLWFKTVASVTPLRHLQATRTLASNATVDAKDRRSLKGKVAIVTASTDGIGLAVAKRLAQDGASVVISSRKEKNVTKAVEQLTGEGLDVCGTTCHVGSADDRKKLVALALEWKGAIDCLVSNAAVNPFFGPTLDTPEDAWDKIFDINVKAAFMLTKEIVPHITKRGGGSVVYISSIGGYQPLAALGAYSVSKTALLGLTKAVAVDAVTSNIRVNCVCPGVIQTKFSSALWNDPSVADEVNKTIPMHRLGQPEEISGIVSFLCSDDSSYLTGESIAVAGGFFTRL